MIAVPKSLNDLHWLREGIHATGVRVFILGLGSNVLISDSGWNGLIIRTHQLNKSLLRVENTMTLRVGCSVTISSLLRYCGQEGFGGLELLTGIPGSVGGAVKMNAGTHLGETQSKVCRVVTYALNGLNNLPNSLIEPKIFQGEQLKFEYRRSPFIPTDSIIYESEWVIHEDQPENIQYKIREILARRKQSQPLEFPSCGSVFKNPSETGLKAWQVIDQLGLRGFQLGKAQFSPKHCNFIVNLGAAKAKDVLALIELAKSRADRQLGVQLEEEVVYLS